MNTNTVTVTFCEDEYPRRARQVVLNSLACNTTSPEIPLPSTPWEVASAAVLGEGAELWRKLAGGDLRGERRDEMTGYFPPIRDEDEHDARLDQIDALITCIQEYEARVHPIGEPTRWARICFRWDQVWRWKIAPALIGGLSGVLLVLAWMLRHE